MGSQGVNLVNKQFVVNAAKNELELRGLFTKYDALKAEYKAENILYSMFLRDAHQILERVDLLLNTHKFNVSVIQSMKVNEGR